MAGFYASDGTYYDPELAQQAIDELQSIADDIQNKSMRKALFLLDTVNPAWGNEPVTASFHNPMQASHHQHVTDLEALYQKILNDIANLKAVKAYYTGADQAGAQGLKKKDD